MWTGLPRLGTDENGEPCIGRQWVQLPPEEVDQAEQYAWDAISYMFSEIPELAHEQPSDDCPVDPGDEMPPQRLDDVIRQTIVDQLPRPDPSVPPGYALTGMAAYLVTDHDLTYGPTEHEVDLDIMQLTVHVTGEATTTVDWGDGSEPRTYDEPGRPYPDGGVTYAYADTGSYRIEIVDTWRLNYDVHRGGRLIISDVVEFDLAPVTLDDLEVRELQAVRTSPG